MNVHLSASPVLPPTLTFGLTERLSIKQILEQAQAPDWFMEFGVVRLNGHVIPRENWRHVRIKPDADGVLELCVVPQKGGDWLPILATLAVVVLAAGVSGGLLGPAGLGLLGPAFLAGHIGAAAAGAAIGIAGQLAISMLTAPPALASQKEGAQRDLAQAGIAQNAVTLLETLPVVFGTMLISPPQISPAYTTLEADEITVHAIVGVQGRCQIANILVNGTVISLFDGISYQSREGGPASAALTLCQLTCIEQNAQVTLSNFRTQLETGKNDALLDQTTPANSEPDYHYFTTDGAPDEIWLRLLCPSGIVNTTTGNSVGVPLRVEIRRVGDTPWRKLPTCHLVDVQNGRGPIRTQIKLKWQTPPSGRKFSNATGEYPIYEINNITGITQTFEYQADAYFQDTSPDYSGVNPVMTAATTSGWTMSASSVIGGNNAWNAADNSTVTGWRPAANSLPDWIKFDAGSAVTIKSYTITGDIAGLTEKDYSPTIWYVEGSNDNTNWTLLDDAPIDVSDLCLLEGHYQIGHPGSYRYYRFTFTAVNGSATQDLQIMSFRLFTHDAYGAAIAADTSTTPGSFAKHTSGSNPRCLYGSLDRDGATFYLDPAQWPNDVAYEVRIKRGLGYAYGNLVPKSYSYGGVANSDFFDYHTSGGLYVVRVGQKDARSDTVVEVFSTVSNDVPVDTTGIACIAIELKNTVINSISAEFSSYAPIYSGGVWSDAEAVTANPAALYRHLLLGHANPDPTAGEIIDETAFSTWYDRCVTRGYEVNAVVQGRSIDEVKRMIAYCGYASPRDTNLVSIAEDYDRAGESIMQMISPLNARNLGNTISLPKLPHAIYAEFIDAADNYRVARSKIYRRGFDVNTASYFDSITYDGFTSAAKVAARAAFDLLQMELRNSEHRYEMGMEGYSITRGMLVGLNDDTLDTKMGYGLIKAITLSGANVTGLELDNVYAFSANQDDLQALVEGLDLSNATGIAIRIEADGTVLIKTATNTADGKTITFTTPFDYAASGIAIGNLVALGVAGKSHKRMIVHGVIPTGLETRTVILRDEAPELFA